MPDLLAVGSFIRRGLSRFGGIFGCAFGLDLTGVEDAVGAHSAVGQRLRTVTESIGKRIASGVGNLEIKWRLLGLGGILLD